MKEIKELSYNNVLKKIHRKIDNLAEAKGMTRQEFEEWSERESDRLEISEEEFMYIRAYLINEAIIKLIKEGKHKEATKLEKEFPWIPRLDDLDLKAPDYFKHLERVCTYHKDKYGKEYEFNWLLDYDDTVYYGAMESKSAGNYKRLAKD